MSQKKDVLFLLQFFYPEYISSATLPFDTARALVEQGYTVDVLCGYPHEYCDEEKIPKKETVQGIGIQRVKYIQMNRSGKLGRIVNYFSFTFSMLLRLFRMRKYKTLYVYSNPPVLPWVAALASKLFGCKLVFVAYDLYPEVATLTNTISETGLIARTMRHINKVVFRRATAVVALSNEMKRSIVELRNIAPEKVYVHPNWYKDEYVEMPKTHDLSNNKFTDVVKGRFVVSYLGNMGYAQDMQTVLDAMMALKDHPDICFLLAGHGVKVEAVKETVAREGITNAYIYDFQRGKDYLDALQISDCAIVTLERGLTGLCVPSKTYAYMMQGMAILAIMEDSDIADNMRAGAGVCVANGDGESLARYIREIQADPARLEAMRETCRDIYLKNYTTEIATKKYVDMMEEI